MLTLDFAAHCLPAEYHLVTGGRRTLGLPGGLTVLAAEEGRATLETEAGRLPVPAGSLVVFSGALALACAGTCRMEGVTLRGRAPEELAAGLDAPLVLDAASHRTAAGLVRWLAQRDQQDAAAASELSYALLCRLAGAQQPKEKLPPLVSAAIAGMQNHFGEVYGVEELAQALGVSKSHLIRVFTAAMGVSPGRYLTGIRIEAAQRLLLDPALELETIAGLCGFSSANYLCRVFKKATGVTPAAWRRQHRAAAPAHPAEEWEESLYL